MELALESSREWKRENFGEYFVLCKQQKQLYGKPPMFWGNQEYMFLIEMSEN